MLVWSGGGVGGGKCCGWLVWLVVGVVQPGDKERVVDWGDWQNAGFELKYRNTRIEDKILVSTLGPLTRLAD